MDETSALQIATNRAFVFRLCLAYTMKKEKETIEGHEIDARFVYFLLDVSVLVILRFFSGL